jgi:Fic family protein
MNLILMKYGFPPAIVKAENAARFKYYESLELASMGNDLKPFIQLITECVEDSLQKYIGAVK